ncbi:unnamed protein product, partial [Polarella glacialis]
MLADHTMWLQYVFATVGLLGICCTSLEGATRVVVLRSLLVVMLVAHAMYQPDWLETARSWLNKRLLQSREVDEDAAEVQALLEQMRVSNTKAACAMFMHLAPALSLVTACASYLLQAEGATHESTSHFNLCLIGYAAVGLVMLKQESMSPKSCATGMVCLNLFCAFFPMACVPADHWFVNSSARFGARMLVGLGTMNHRHTGWLSIAYVASCSYGNFANAKLVPGLHAGYGTIAECAFPEVIISVLIWAAMHFVEYEVVKSLKASMHLDSAKSETSAVQRMLNIFCDVQVQLDSGLRILSSDPKLSRFFRTKVSLEKVGLINFVADSDKQRFVDFIENSKPQLAPTSTDGLEVHHSSPGLLHAKMLSATGEPFGVQLCHVCRLDWRGSLQHFIGICDESQRPPEEIDENIIEASRIAAVAAVTGAPQEQDQ